MSLYAWAEARARATTVWDLGLLKVYCVLFGMVVGAYVAPFVLRNVGWFVGGIVALGVWFGYRWIATPMPREPAADADA